MSSSSSSSSPDKSTHFEQKKVTLFTDKNISTLCKPLIVTGLLLFLFYVLVSNRNLDQTPNYIATLRQKAGFFANDHHFVNHSNDPTNLSHIAIGISGSMGSLKSRKAYIEAWWRPNVTKGYLFLDREPKEFFPWPVSSPPYKIYEDTSRYKAYDRHQMRHAIRMVRVIVQTFRELREGIRWYVLADDDTILFLDNLVELLSRYDHTKYFYIGENSETVQSNFDHSFEMAFGGAGCAVSYPLAEALAKNMDVCIKRYPFLYGSDHLLQSCVSDLGVSLTHEKGFHQIDLRRDASGFLSSHPQAAALSLHHLDAVEPIFPSMQRTEAFNHLMKAVNTDQSRLLQQTICYDKLKSWTFSMSWGYSAHVYERIIPPSVLERPLETFTSWRRPSRTPFMFNTRWLSKNPCDMPHVFFFESVANDSKGDHVITTYTRRFPRNLPPCSLPLAPMPSQNDSSAVLPSDIAKIVVLSPTTKNAGVGTRRECCDVLDQAEKNVTMIKYRNCMKNEILGVD